MVLGLEARGNAACRNIFTLILGVERVSFAPADTTEYLKSLLSF